MIARLVSDETRRKTSPTSVPEKWKFMRENSSNVKKVYVEKERPGGVFHTLSLTSGGSVAFAERQPEVDDCCSMLYA